METHVSIACLYAKVDIFAERTELLLSQIVAIFQNEQIQEIDRVYILIDYVMRIGFLFNRQRVRSVIIG